MIALVTSDRSLFNENAVRLREEIGRRLGISHLARLDVETAFYRPKSRRKGTPPRIHPVEVHFCSAGAAPIRLDARPISADDQTVLPGESGLTLGDIAEVNIAPWLGPEGVFVLNSEAARRIPGAELIPVIDTDDIGRASDTLLAPKRFVLFTAPNAEPEGAVAEHILSRRHLLPEQARKSSRWWLPPEKIVPERIGHDRLLIPRIARRLRVIDLPAGVAVMNHNLTVASPNHGISLGELRAILESPESQAWIARNAPRLENDFYSITTKMLRRLPVRRSSGAHSPELLAA